MNHAASLVFARRSWRLASLLFLVPLLLLAGNAQAQEQEQRRGGASEQAKEHEREATRVVITEKNDKGQVTVTRGDLVVVRLAATGEDSTGWVVANNNPQLLRPIGQSHLQRVSDSEEGISQQQVFRFRAVKPGTTQLQLNFLNPLKKPVLPSKIFGVEITVR